MFKIACSFQFCRSTDLVRFHRIAKYLFSLLPWIFIVEHCASHFKLPLFDKINWVSRFSLPVKELTFDCLNIMKLRTDLYHWVSCYTIKVWKWLKELDFLIENSSINGINWALEILSGENGKVAISSADCCINTWCIINQSLNPKVISFLEIFNLSVLYFQDIWKEWII